MAETSLVDAEKEHLSSIDLCSKYMSRGRATISNMFGGQIEARSSGATLYTTANDSYVNCAGYGVLLFGATNGYIVDAVIDQIKKHPISARVFIDEVSPRAAAALANVCPDGLDKVHFCNGGAEAVETAVKLARINGCRRLITTENGYHGCSMGALSVSGRPFYQNPFLPLLPDVTVIPFDNAQALDDALTGAPRSCFIVEPIQGEGGVNVPSESYLADVSELCKRHDCFLVVDEILTGLGRLGQWWGMSGQDVAPDVLLVGKSLSGGVIPLAAAVATSPVYEPFDKDPLLHGSTFGGSPVAAAAALAALEAVEKFDVLAKAAAIGDRLISRIRAAADHAPSGVVKAVRGKGLLIGIEFAEPGYAGEMMLGLFDNGVIANHSVNNSSVVRFTPPALISDDELTTVEAAIDESLKFTDLC